MFIDECLDSIEYIQKFLDTFRQIIFWKKRIPNELCKKGWPVGALYGAVISNKPAFSKGSLEINQFQHAELGHIENVIKCHSLKLHIYILYD